MNLSPLFSFGYNQQPFILFFSINLPFDNLYPVYYQKKDKYTSYELLNIFCKLQMNKNNILQLFLLYLQIITKFTTVKQ